MIALIGAMDEEVKAIQDLMTDIEPQQIGPVVFMQGLLNGKPVLLFKSGVGISMAAMSTALCLSHFAIEGIVNVGTAGGLLDTQHVLDLVISDRVTYHDLDISAFGNSRSFGPDNRYVFHSDAAYIEKAKRLTADYLSVHIGPMVSGHQFISTEDQVSTIRHFYPEAICTEMEGAAIAHVATQFGCPFIIIRSISDLVIHPKNEMSFEQYLHQASARSAQLCFEFVKQL